MSSRKQYKCLLVIILLISTFASSCKKNEDLKNQIAGLESRVSNIESQLSQIASSIISLQQQGKLNVDEITSLKNLTENLKATTNGLKSSESLTIAEISNLKIAIKQAINKIQFEDLKMTITNLDDLVNKMASDQKLSDLNSKNLQNIISKISVDLETLKTIDNLEEINGKIEKGGFLKGSTIALYEINGSLFQTGRSFSSTITDNYGTFNLKVQNLRGKMGKIVADGFYFNEVSGKNSTSKISLNGIVRIDSSDVINVNVLTTLEGPRVEYLMSNGASFENAKSQAATEVLNLFGITNPGISRAEKISLIGSSNRNNILLAISTMLVGYRTDSELLEIINDIAQDIKIDGKLTNKSLGDDIATHLYYLNQDQVVSQVKSKYSLIYPDSVINQINLNYINNFKQLNIYAKSYNLIEYPATNYTVYNGKNILSNEFTAHNSNIFEISANLKSKALKLKIEITPDFGGAPIPSNFYLSSLPGTNQNWIIKTGTDKTATLEPNAEGLNTVAFTVQSPTNSAKLIVKFYENGSSIPSKTKIVQLSF